MGNSCLAHVINLAMQMLISTYSKLPHFDPKQLDAHILTSRDEVGLVRAILLMPLTSYQECSSSKRKEMWRTIQIKGNNGPCIDAFVDELRWEEPDSAKRDKIRELKLTSKEWAWVNIFLGLLSVCLLFRVQNNA
ncbi:hypothetical protein L208DRAFT_1231977 [Tricholoma matsutake]|nr:hypothetical protein L208DRAFT_1231977 [Tricholoma matsutake 945]